MVALFMFNAKLLLGRLEFLLSLMLLWLVCLQKMVFGNFLNLDLLGVWN